MRGARSRWIAGVVLGVLAACAPQERAPSDTKAALGGEVAARVGDQTIALDLVARVASVQAVSKADALHLLVDDAVAAEAARARGLAQERPTSWRLTAARARLTSERVLADAKAKGPPTDEEVRALTERHWREVDRPEAVRVVHALVRRPKEGADPGLLAQARALAARLHDEEVAASSADDFLERAKALDHPAELAIVAEKLPPFTDAGWITEGAGRMDEVFARAAHALAKPGDTSAVVETPFGWHVIRLVERVPEQRMPLEARRVAFSEAAYATRARAALDAILAERRARAPVSISPSAERLMRSVSAPARSAGASP